MSNEETTQDAQQIPTAPAAMAAANKKRPRLDLNDSGGAARERKRGKSMFGILIGTLNKAKIEDKERNASEAAKKRQLIEQRLQAKLRKENDSVRRAEEAKKEKTLANRKEEDLQLKDSIIKLRRTRLPLLANFLSTADIIPLDDETLPLAKDPLALVPRSHPPPLYYLPAILTSAQENFLSRRKVEVREAAEKEWQAFQIERTAGIEEIQLLRQHVAEEEARKKSKEDEDKQMVAEDSLDVIATDVPQPAETATSAPVKEVEMDVAEETLAIPASDEPREEKKDESSTMQADDDDAVEY